MGWLNRSIFAGLRGARAAPVLCTPDAGCLHAGAGPGAGDLALVFLMWLAMVLAMMLPSADARRLDRRARGTDWIGRVALGYLAVWTCSRSPPSSSWADGARRADGAMAPASLVLAGSTPTPASTSR
jgi:hypothetical protein